MADEKTTVQLDKSVAFELGRRKKFGETYNSVIKKLIESTPPSFNKKLIDKE